MAKYSTDMLEEELKNKVANDWSGGFIETALPGFDGGMPHAQCAEEKLGARIEPKVYEYGFLMK